MYEATVYKNYFTSVHLLILLFYIRVMHGFMDHVNIDCSSYLLQLLIPTVSVLKISKEKTARIIPNAVGVATEDDKHVFCSLLSRDSTFRLMVQVWKTARSPGPQNVLSSTKVGKCDCSIQR
jgi:hypothetical protein